MGKCTVCSTLSVHTRNALIIRETMHSVSGRTILYGIEIYQLNLKQENTISSIISTYCLHDIYDSIPNFVDLDFTYFKAT